MESGQPSQPVWMILLLGSYDQETRRLLQGLKEYLAEFLMVETSPVFTFLLEDIEIYVGDLQEGAGTLTIITDANEGKISSIVFRNSSMINMLDPIPVSEKASEQASAIEEAVRRKFLFSHLFKQSILEKLESASQAASLVFVVRHLELTRGGEYIELVYLLGGVRKPTPSKVYFMQRQGVELSEMALEILDKYGVNCRVYTDESGLHREVLRLCKYYFKRAM